MTDDNLIFSEEPDPDEEDYVEVNGLVVFTRSGLLRRGFCCQNGCLNCPIAYGKDQQDGPGAAVSYPEDLF